MNAIQLGAWGLALILVFVYEYFSEFNPETHEISSSFAFGPMFYEKHDWWDTGLIFKGLGWALFIVMAFLLVERIVQRKKER